VDERRGDDQGEAFSDAGPMLNRELTCQRIPARADQSRLRRSTAKLLPDVADVLRADVVSLLPADRRAARAKI
jgi:hypothetical protein